MSQTHRPLLQLYRHHGIDHIFGISIQVPTKLTTMNNFKSVLVLFLVLVELFTARAAPQQGQLIKETITDDIITYPDGSRREEIIDDKFISRPDGGTEEIKTDRITGRRGSGSYYPSGSYNPSYPIRSYPSGSYSPSWSVGK